MSLSVFSDKSHAPEPAEVASVLGPAAFQWTELISRISATHAPITEHWNHSGAKYGWSLRLKRKERVVIYMTPQSGCFLVGIALGGKAEQAARESSLPERTLALIDGAPKYAEGRGIRFSVETPEDVAAALALAAAKMAN